MPLARIVTRSPEKAISLADYLAQKGYIVQMVAPGEPAQSFADFEITFDTCASEQALERAGELASGLDAEIVVAPGAVPEAASQQVPVESPAPTTREIEVSGPAWFDKRSQAVRETLGKWRRQGSEMLAAVSHRLSNQGRALLEEAFSASRRGGIGAGMWLRGAWLVSRQAIRTGTVDLQRKIQETWAHAAERARIRALEAQQWRESRQREEEERRIHEIQVRQQREQAAALEAANLRAQEQPAPVPVEPAEAVSADEEEIIDHPAGPIVLRPAAQRKSPLVAYTCNRGRDWKMAFVGAAVASSVIMLVSFSVQHRPLPQNDAQQKLPFGAAAAQPQAPTLMIPSVKVPAPPPALPVAAKKTTPATPKAHSAPAPETQVEHPDEYFEEVVVHHYPTHQSAKARTDEDGVKRISDLE